MFRARALTTITVTAFLGAAVLLACSDDETPSPGGTSSGGTSGSGTSGGGTSGSGTSGGGTSGTSGSSGDSDAGQLVNGCRNFVDRRDDDDEREIPWDFSVGSAPERCMQIRAGQKVTFTAVGGAGPADFQTHPVNASGGDTPNPIADLDTGTGEVTFAQPGTFGFVCGIHGNSMAGAILVVE